jgi:hypothetical protein
MSAYLFLSVTYTTELFPMKRLVSNCMLEVEQHIIEITFDFFDKNRI